MNIRELTKEGEETLVDCILDMKQGKKTKVPDLNRSPYSVPATIGTSIDIDEKKKFKTRMEMGKYLSDILSAHKIDRISVREKVNMWSWLSYIWLNQLIEDAKPKELARYVCGSAWNRYYRHIVASSYYIFSIHGEAYSKMFLDRPLASHGEVFEQLVSRQDVINNRAVVRVIHQLYWDEETKSVKKNVASKDIPGTARRFGEVLKQLQLTYDLHGMAEKEIMKILPAEFNKWKTF